MYFLAVFGLLSVAWDITARRSVGVRHWWRAGILKDGVVAGDLDGRSSRSSSTSARGGPGSRTGESYGRLWAEQNPDQGVQWLPPALRSFWKYHQDMWGFHNGLETPHSYSAHPLGWIVQWRPTSFFYPTEVSGLTGQQAQDACGAASCSQAIVALGNPVLWWCAAAAILVAVVWLIRYRDWRAGAVLSGIVAGWLPWFAYEHRTIFTFYSIVFAPWVVLTLVYVIGLVVGPKDLDPRETTLGDHRLRGARRPDRGRQRVLLPDLVRVDRAVRLLALAHVAADLGLTAGRRAGLSASSPPAGSRTRTARGGPRTAPAGRPGCGSRPSRAARVRTRRPRRSRRAAAAASA